MISQEYSVLKLGTEVFLQTNYVNKETGQILTDLWERMDSIIEAEKEKERRGNNV
jgi:hypothetical protein